MRGPIRPLGATYLFLLLGFALPLFLAQSLLPARGGGEALAAWVIVLYAAARLSLLAWRGQARLVSLTFYAFVYVWLGVAPLLQVLAGEFPLGGFYEAGATLQALGIVAVGLAAHECGGIWARARRSSTSSIWEWVFERTLAPRRSLVLGVLAALVTLALVWRLGGMGSLLVARNDLALLVKEQLAGSTGLVLLLVFFTLLRVPIFVAAYLTTVVVRRYRRRWRDRLLLVVLLLLNALVNNPLNSPRYWFGTTVLSFAFLLLPWHRVRSFTLWTVALILALLFVFPHSDRFRRSLETNVRVAQQRQPLVYKSDYDAFQQLINAREYVAANGLAFGQQVGGTLLFWVPRSLWAHKPIPSGELVARATGYRFTNLSFPLWAEAYIDGGLVAVLLVFLAYGYAAERIEQFYLRHQDQHGLLATLLVPMYSAYQIFLLRGALMSTLSYFVPTVLLLLVCTRARIRRVPSIAPVQGCLEKYLQDGSGVPDHAR